MPTIPSGRLGAELQQLVSTRPRAITLAMLSEQTGLSLNTISRVSLGQIKDPSSSTVELLYSALTGKTLTLSDKE